MIDTALLVIDVQVGLIDKGIYQADTLLPRIKGLIDAAHAAAVPIIYVQHNGGKTGTLGYKTPGWAIHPAVAPQPDEPIVHKTTSDSFHETDLQQHLEKLGIKNLVIAGMQTEYCINATTRRAAELGYGVTLVGDAHSTFDRKTISAQRRIDEHNTALSALAQVKPAESIQFK